MQFISKKYKALRIVLDPKGYQAVEGRRVTVGLNRLYPTGKSIEFQNGLYDTNDPKIIKLLKNHPDYGSSFFSDELGESANQATDEAIAKENEKKAMAEKAGSICPDCGKKFANAELLDAHAKTHEK